MEAQCSVKKHEYAAQAVVRHQVSIAALTHPACSQGGLPALAACVGLEEAKAAVDSCCLLLLLQLVLICRHCHTPAVC